MDSQQVLLVAAIAAFAMATVFVGLAGHTFFSQDIRGVLDDLSGRTRQRGVAASMRAGTAARGRGGASARSAPARGEAATAARGVGRDEDAVETRVNTLLSRRRAAPMASAVDVDAIPTMVVHGDGQVPAPPSSDDGAPSPDAVASGRPVAFTITQRIVLTHAEGVIAAR